MECRKWIKKNENKIISIFVSLLILIFMAMRYDFYYELNDDVVIKNISSGAYTGVPESRNIQMLYPISFLISLLYRLFPTMPVYGILIVGSQLLCVYLVTNRCLRFRSNLLSKLLFVILMAGFVVGVFLPHMVFVQYTVTCALLAATAVFLFLTTENKEIEALTALQFLKKNRSSFVLVIVAFAMRSEMLLLVLPMIGVAGICKWSTEELVFCKNNFKKYFMLFGSILGGIGIVSLIHSVAYGGRDWKNFTEFFDARTELYDFQGFPTYEGNESLYESLSLTEAQLDFLILNYNFGMDEKVDARMLSQIAQHSADNKSESFLTNVKESLRKYSYRTLHREPAGSEKEDDYPWNLLVILSYLSVTIAGIWYGIANGEKALKSVMLMGWKLLLLGGVRSGLWMFILMRGRTPDRITHPLYVMELFILWAILLVACSGIDAKLYGRVKATLVFPLMIGIVIIACVPGMIKEVDANYAKREEANLTDNMFMQYRDVHEGSFYWMDVDAFVDYSEKIFDDENRRPDNYDIMGGWACKSPLYEKKLAYYGFSSMRESLIENKNVFYVAELTTGTEGLERYYESLDILVKAELVDSINGILGVYQISKAE